MVRRKMTTGVVFSTVGTTVLSVGLVKDLPALAAVGGVLIATGVALILFWKDTPPPPSGKGTW